MSYYSVIYYSPSRPIDERVNIGVVAWDDNGLVYKFVEDWQHIERFAEGRNIEFLREFAESFGEQFSTVQAIEDALSHWYYGVVQFTEARGSTSPIETLLKDITRLFLWTEANYF